MMVQVSSADWRDVQQRLGKLEKEQGVLTASVNALIDQQSILHKENRDELKENRLQMTAIKASIDGDGEQDGLRIQVDRVANLVNLRFEDVARLVKIVGWLIGTGIVGIGIWFTSLEVRHMLTADSAHPISEVHQPVNATADSVHF